MCAFAVHMALQVFFRLLLTSQVSEIFLFFELVDRIVELQGAFIVGTCP